MVCSEPLTYHEKSEEVTCAYCGRIEQGHITCPKGHYICDLCHNQDSMIVIEKTVLTTESTDPFEIAERAMSFDGLPMLGCQHAYIAGGALMAAIKNNGSRDITDEDIQEVFKRTGKQAHGGYCGLSGVCGIAPAIGACFAVLTGSKCGKDEEQMITMEAVTRISRAITDLTGPSCCKAYVRTSLETAVDYLDESLGIKLPQNGAISCVFQDKHPHGCREARCPYFNGDIPTVRTSSDTEDIISSTYNYSRSISPKDGLEENMEYLVTKALEFGAEKAKLINTDSVVVKEWVRWKCQYGCPLYDKDGFHPPCAPDAESTKKVIKEYDKAILLNGPKGKLLTEAAGKLEGEAYRTGYYKAFALTALSSGPPGAT
jgi:hypothetical protein